MYVRFQEKEYDVAHYHYSEGETEETAQRHAQYFSVAKLVRQANKEEGVQTTQSFPLLSFLVIYINYTSTISTE
jgi:hypothetical protein